MSSINKFIKMIKDLNSETLSEICEQFLFDHEGAMKILTECCYKVGMQIDDTEIKNFMSDMHSNGDFDNVVCFGIELSEYQLYKNLRF